MRRQREDWQREATRYLATERTTQALHVHHDHGHVHEAETREDARKDLVDNPETSRLILTHTNDAVQALNTQARDRLKARGELGDDVEFKVERGERYVSSHRENRWNSFQGEACKLTEAMALAHRDRCRRGRDGGRHVTGNRAAARGSRT